MSVKAIFYDGASFEKKEVGTAMLEGKRAVLTGVADELSWVNVFEPDTLKKLTPKDGERYIRALPSAFRGHMLWAELVEDDPL